MNYLVKPSLGTATAEFLLGAASINLIIMVKNPHAWGNQELDPHTLTILTVQG